MEDAVMEGQKVDLGHDCDSLTSSSSSRDNRWRRRVMKTREMTEDEMMQLALRLSKQEASQEEDDVRKAIHQSRTEGDLSHSNQDFTSATFSSSDCSQDSPSHRPMSPTFPRTPSKASTGHMTPARVKLTSADQREPSEPESQTQDDRGEDVTSGRSYDLILDGSDEDDYTADPLSPVFNHETCAPPAGNTAPPIRSTGRSRVQLDEEGRAADLQTVKYYWGVPFCPRGLSPDRYTQVIVSQLDTYSRTLKEARRLLWRKAKWRKAITPDTNVSSPEPRQTDADSVVETPEGLDHDLQDMDVDVCPETQLSERDKKDVEDDEDDEGPRLEGDAVKSPAGASPDVFESEVLDSAALEQEHEATEDRKSLSEVEEICDQENEASEGSDVECPLCHVSFLLADVEMHAAFCEGDKRSRARPRKRRRREAARESVQEKCYICQTMVSVSNYSHHTRLCVQLSVKPAKGNLLSALEQSEAAQLGTGSKSYMSECAAHCSSTVKPGSSGSRVQPSLLGVGLNEIIELEDDDDDDDDEDSSVRMSSGVSAATDLLDRGSRRSQKPKR